MTETAAAQGIILYSPDLLKDSAKSRGELSVSRNAGSCPSQAAILVEAISASL